MLSPLKIGLGRPVPALPRGILKKRANSCYTTHEFLAFVRAKMLEDVMMMMMKMLAVIVRRGV